MLGVSGLYQNFVIFMIFSLKKFLYLDFKLKFIINIYDLKAILLTGAG